MLSVEKIDNTLQIGKFSDNKFCLRKSESSKGLSSGHLEVFKTESELCLRPGSPERYKSILLNEEATPPTKLSFEKDSPSQNSFQDFSNFKKKISTPVKDLSLSLEFEAEENPDMGISFFSSANEVREMQLFEERENKGGAAVDSSFASTSSKTNKVFNEISKGHIKPNRCYRNNCKIQCNMCSLLIVTDLKLDYPSVSL